MQILKQDRSKIGDEAHFGPFDQVESHFFLFGDSVSVGARQVHGLRQTYHRLRNHFWMHPMVLLGYEAQVKACLGPFADSVNLDAR